MLNGKNVSFLNGILLYWITGTVYVVGLKGMFIARWDVLDGLCEKWVCFEKFVGCTHVLIFWLAVFFQNSVHCTTNNFGCTMYWYNNMLSIFRISITTDKENNEYLFTHSVSACYVPGTCVQTYNIFQNTKFSIKTCDYTGGFLDSSMYFKNRYNILIKTNLWSF